MAPSSTQEFGGITYRDKNNANMAYIIGFDWSSGSSGLKFLWRNKFSSGARSTSGSNVDCTLILGVTSGGVQYFEGNGRWNNNVVPLTTDSKTLGTSSLKWKGVYATNFYGALTGDVTGNCSGSSGSCTGNAATATTAGNVTGTVAIANGGTGATTRLNAVKALTNENVGTNATYFITITDSWGKAGYTSVANAKTVLGLKSAAYTESSAYAAASHTHSYLPLSGGTLTGQLNRQNTGITKGTNPSSTAYWEIYNCDKNGTAYKANCLGLIGTSLTSAGVVTTYIRAIKNTANVDTNCSLGCIYDTANSAGYTFAPTPAANDNTTKIATTAWVQTFCGTTKGYLTSHQSLSNYSTKANTVKSLSISGKTITVTPGSGSAYTLTTQDTVYTHPTSAGNKHIPSGGSSGQYLKYSSSGTATWANLPSGAVSSVLSYSYSNEHKTAPITQIATVVQSKLAVVTIDVTNSVDLCKVTCNNIFLVALHMLVGTNSYKQDSVNYGSILQQTSKSRSRLVALIYPYSTSITFTIAWDTYTQSTSNSFSLNVYQ